MSKKTKVILTIFSLLMITFIVTSLAYAYYSTRIIGNKNSTSINLSVTGSKNAIVQLSELNSPILKISSFNVQMIEPGYENVKKYTVQNIGTGEAIYSIYLTDVYNDFERYEDVRYILYRNKGKNSIGSNLDDYEIISEGVYPRTDNLLVANQIIEQPNEYYTYALKIIYKDISNESQAVDMDHTFSGKFTVSGLPNDLNEFDESTLAYKIIDNSLNYKNNTVLRSNALTKLGKDIPLNNELELIKLKDNYGDAYYFRGNVLDNYLEINNTCFRIVGIQGDGSIKLILANEGTCSNSNENTGILNQVSYNLDNSANYNSNYDVDLKNYLENWVENKNFNKIINTDWCNDINLNNGIYETYSRIKDNINPTLYCNNKIIESKVGVLTSDEIAISGSILYKDNLIANTYLNQNATNYKWWTMSPKEYSDMFVYAGYNGLLTSTNANNNEIYARPVIVLDNNLKYISGDGTKEFPYEVE